VTAGRLNVETETGRVIVLRSVEITGRLKVETEPGRLSVEIDVIVFKIVEASAVATLITVDASAVTVRTNVDASAVIVLIRVDASAVTTLIRVDTTGGGVTVTAGRET